MVAKCKSRKVARKQGSPVDHTSSMGGNLNKDGKVTNSNNLPKKGNKKLEATVSNRFDIIANEEESLDEIAKLMEIMLGGAPTIKDSESGQSAMEVGPGLVNGPQPIVVKPIISEDVSIQARNKPRRRKDKNKKVLGPVAKHSKPGSRPLDPDMIKRSLKEDSRQLVCVAPTPSSSHYQSAQQYSGSGVDSLTGNKNMPSLTLIPLAFSGKANEHGLGDVVASQLDIVPNQSGVATLVVGSNQGAELVVAVASNASCSTLSSP
ncbi:hypothetical protein SLA2020_051810 [Shorea laevis]